MSGASSTISLKDRRCGGSVDEYGSFLVVLLQANRPMAPSSRHALTGIHMIMLGRGSARRWDRKGNGTLQLQIADAAISSTHALVTRQGTEWYRALTV